MMDRVAYSMPPTFSPFEKKSAAAQCPIYDRSCLEELSISPEMTPAQEMWPLSLWVASVFVYMWVFHQTEGFIHCFVFDSGIFTKSGGLVHCDIFQYTLLNSQSLLGKVSWGNRNLLLSL